jgi:hypothetical protein
LKKGERFDEYFIRLMKAVRKKNKK